MFLIYTVLLNAFSFICVIVLGYVLKKIGFFSKENFKVVSKIVVSVTLPAAIVTNFNKITPEASLLFMVAIGMGCNLLTVGFGYWLKRKGNGVDKAFHMINYSGYNIGCFALPYVQNFLGPTGLVATCLFDAGNSIMCTGATYSFAALAVQGEEKVTLKEFAKKLFRSVPLVTYMIMLLLSLLHLKLPDFILSPAAIIGNANGFMAMFLIGLGFEMRLNKKYIKGMFSVLFVRYACGVLFASLFYFLLPFPLEIRQVLVLLSFAPISSVATVFTERIGGDFELSSAINSMSILISIVVMTSMLMAMKV